MTAQASSKKTTDATVKLSSVYARRASDGKIDTTRAAKLIRARMRANFDKMCELSPNIKQNKQSAKDGNRWPSEITREAAQFLLATGASSE
jgi:hypothetical protein